MVRPPSVLSVEFLCPVTHWEEEGLLQSQGTLSGCLIDGHAATGPLTDCWMNIPLIDVTHNWPDLPASPLSLPDPFHTANSELTVSVSGVVGVLLFFFTAATLWDWLQHFWGWGLFRQARLASAADWCNWSKDEEGLFAPEDIWLMNSSSSGAFREWNQWAVVCTLQGPRLLLLFNFCQTTRLCQV